MWSAESIASRKTIASKIPIQSILFKFILDKKNQKAKLNHIQNWMFWLFWTSWTTHSTVERMNFGNNVISMNQKRKSLKTSKCNINKQLKNTLWILIFIVLHGTERSTEIDADQSHKTWVQVTGWEINKQAQIERVFTSTQKRTNLSNPKNTQNVNVQHHLLFIKLQKSNESVSLLKQQNQLLPNTVWIFLFSWIVSPSLTKKELTLKSLVFLSNFCCSFSFFLLLISSFSFFFACLCCSFFLPNKQKLNQSPFLKQFFNTPFFFHFCFLKKDSHEKPNTFCPNSFVSRSWDCELFCFVQIFCLVFWFDSFLMVNFFCKQKGNQKYEKIWSSWKIRTQCSKLQQQKLWLKKKAISDFFWTKLPSFSLNQHHRIWSRFTFYDQHMFWFLFLFSWFFFCFFGTGVDETEISLFHMKSITQFWLWLEWFCFVTNKILNKQKNQRYFSKWGSFPRPRPKNDCVMDLQKKK